MVKISKNAHISHANLSNGLTLSGLGWCEILFDLKSCLTCLTCEAFFQPDQ